MMRMKGCLAIGCLLSLATIGLASSKPKDPMNITEGCLDEIHLKVATLKGGVPVVIRPFSTDGVDRGTGGDDAKNEKRTEAVTEMVKNGPGILVESFKKTVIDDGRFKGVLPAETAPLPENALVVEGRFVTINPGSKAKRYWGGFGAGKSGVQVSGTVKDSSGRVLAEFTHMKNSGIGMFGGNYIKFLSDDTRDVGHDIATFLGRWAAGEDLQKD